MSNFYNNLTEYINTHIKEYCKIISQKYDLNEDEVFSIWTGNAETPASKPLAVKKPSSPVAKPVSVASASGTSVADFDLTPQGINKATKPILVSICKSYNLPYSGTKDELKPRILEALGLIELSESKSEKKEVKKPPTKTLAKRSPAKEELIEKIVKNVEPLRISRNKWNNYEHFESHLVFNSQTQQVVGRQQDDGTVSSLCAEDIDQCKKYGFKFTLPENLNIGKKEEPVESTTSDVEEDDQVEEIEEEEDEQVEDD